MKWLSLVKEYFGHQRIGARNAFVNVGALSQRRHRLPALSRTLPWRDDGNFADPHYFFGTPLLSSRLYL